MSLHTVAERLEEDLSQVRDKSRRAVEAGRTKVADALDSAASKVSSGADHVSEAARTATERLGASAEWVRTTSGQDLADGFRRMVQEHPARVMLGAIAVGFLIGRMSRAK
jgi:ElaB/YqjD/DUF883 family membrane-anchored ribosome-binding protein